jgi:twitching motility protein PilT
MNIDELLTLTVGRKGSDLHLACGTAPLARIYGELSPIGDYPEISPEVMRDLVYPMLNDDQKRKFETELELDMSYSVPEVCRFRVNLNWDKNGIGAVIRVIPSKIPLPDELGLPPQLVELTELKNGLVLVTGPTGTGKSTTLAALVEKINTEKAYHILTIEDPIEFVYTNKRSIVRQREVGEHTKSFANALKHALRQDPNVVLVGEMRDLETISAILTIAETGHLAFGTLHTNDASQTIDRIIDVFPPHQQAQIRTVLSVVLRGVVCQQLIPRKDGYGMALAQEILICNGGIGNMIREGKTGQIYSSMQTGSNVGMKTMESDVKRLIEKNIISFEAGLKAVSRPETLREMCANLKV